MPTTADYTDFTNAIHCGGRRKDQFRPVGPIFRANTGSLREQDFSILLVDGPVGKRDALARAIAAFDVLFGFQIADLGFAPGLCLFLSLQLLVHTGI